jgi:hypothetical protein
MGWLIDGSAVLAISCTAAFAEVSLSFSDSILVNDTVFHLSDVAAITGDNDSIVSAVRGCVAGSSAPAGMADSFLRTRLSQTGFAELFRAWNSGFQGPPELLSEPIAENLPLLIMSMCCDLISILQSAGKKRSILSFSAT